jgi:predicted mannosyl-3-phosphoglycerate phosphatase (HAD superfamily)
VYRLIAQGTIDEIKFLRQMYKVQLKQETLKTEGEEAAQVARIFRGIQDDPSSRGELFGAEVSTKIKIMPRLTAGRKLINTFPMLPFDQSEFAEVQRWIIFERYLEKEWSTTILWWQYHECGRSQ